MKKSTFFILSIALLTACTHVKQIGELNMISTRNVSPQLNYKAVATYVNSEKKALKRSRAKNIDDAINQTVKSVPGGEFMMNVKIYKTSRGCFAVSGDVWGYEQTQYKGFAVGDVVIYDKMFNNKKAKIVALKSENTCYIEVEGKEKPIEVKYSDLTKAN
jgi:hypothetical protein